MTATKHTKHCRHCGREFTASACDYTVHCPEHRTRGSRRAVEIVATVEPKAVAAAGRTCTVRFATTGACGKPAVFAFESSVTGEIFAECAEHH